ncbi:MAG: hypothetical protein CL878_05555 [Dehalococcoidia bacterium]|nr:hypothetical protein [Dehalococcoidia bacterium]
MKICIYSHQFLPTIGGVQAHTVRLAASLAASGHTVAVVTRTPGEHSYDARFAFRVHRRPTVLGLMQAIASCQVLHLNTWSVLVALTARALGKPMLWFHHDYDLACPKSIAWNGYRCHFHPIGCTQCLARDHAPSQIGRRFAAFSVRRTLHGLVNAHAVHTPFVAERLQWPQALVLGFGTGNGQHDSDDPAPESEKLGRAKDPGVLLVGRLIAEKGVDVLIRALRYVHDAGVDLHVTIVGDGPERVRMARLATSLGVEQSVSFYGEAGPHEAIELMEQSTCVVLPSAWDEPTGYVAVEAMDMGVPVVAARVGGLAGVVSQHGLLFERGDALDLSRQLLTLKAQPDLRDHLVQSGKQHAQAQHDWRALGHDYARVYARLAAGLHMGQSPA